MISDGKARRIAAEWHAPNTGMSALSHTGLIDDRVMIELEREIAQHEGYPATDYVLDCLRDLRALEQYVQVSGHRSPVEGWSALWDGRDVQVQGTRCDLCGDESNSDPDLMCGRVEYADDDLPVTDPCTGTYRTDYR